MLLVALILCYLSGLSVLFTISRKYSLAELVGYSFLLGIGLESVFLFVLDVLNITYTPGILIGLNIFFNVLVCGLNYKNLIALKDEVKFPAFEVSKINYAAVFLFLVIAYLFYIIGVKCLFWPPAEHDTIGSFDKLGRIMAIEGKMKISLFKYHLEGAGGIYPPLFQGSFAYVYLFGASTSKIITLLFFLSLLASFYGLVEKYVKSVIAMLFTLILMVTPEMFSHAALSLDNMPTTAYVCAGALATFVWLDKRDVKYFWIGSIFMAFVIWIRSDTIVFTTAALFIMGVDFLKTRDWKKTLLYSITAIAPFIIWTLYLKLKIGEAQSARFDIGIGYNAARMDMMTAYVSAFLFGGHHGAIDGGQLYGIVFIIFFIALAANLVSIYKAGIATVLADRKYVLLFLFVSFALYFTVFYLINEKTQNAPIWSLMESSFKRGMFCFIPVVLFYTSTNRLTVSLSDKLEKFRTAV